MTNQQLILSGTMRSGTTLMGAMLNAHPDINLIIDKINWYWNRILPYYNLNDLRTLMRALFEQKYFVNICLNALKYDYNIFTKELFSALEKQPVNPQTIYNTIHFLITQKQSIVTGDKSTHSSNIYNQFLQSFNGKIIHMVRNPFDIYYSQKKKVKGKKADARIICLAKNMQKIKDTMLLSLLSKSAQKKYLKGEAIASNIFFENPIAIVDYWQQGIRVALKIKEEQPSNIMLVKYEDVLLKKEEAMRQIVGFLNLDYKDEYFEFHNLKDEKGKSFVSNSSFKQNAKGFDTSRIGNGKGNLSEQEVSYIEESSGELISRFNY